MINKKILMSALSITTALSLAGGATYAFFTDTATSTGNTFGSGTFNLNVRDNDQAFGENVTASFTTPAGWAPGDTYTDYICFRNNGSVPIEQILLDLNSTNSSSVEIDDKIYVKTFELGIVPEEACTTVGVFGSDSLLPFTSGFETRFGINTPISSLLTQIDGTKNVKDDLLDEAAKLNPGQILKIRVGWEFDPTAESNVAGQNLDLSMTFKATQNEISVGP